MRARGHLEASRPGVVERWGRVWPVLVACSLLSSPGSLAAQQDSPPPSDSAALATDTVPATPRDSTRMQVLSRLTRLARPIGVDSAEIRALEDSVALLEGRRRGTAPADGRGGTSAGGASGDTVVSSLLSLPGYSVTEYSGAAAHMDADRRLVLEGDESNQARIRRPEGEVRSDTVVYDPRTERMRTEGGQATLVPSQGEELVSQRLIFDTKERRGTALGAQTTYSQGGEWTVRGDLPSVNPEVVYGSHASFTSCQDTVPHYHFQAGEVKIHGGKWLVARPVTLYFSDVPVAWLPFIAQGLGNGRSSGLLTPRFSINDIVRNSSGYSRRISNVGFYWATNDYMDMALALDWWDNNYTALTGTYRYNWARQFLNGGVNYRSFWRAEGGQELAFDTNHRWQPDERTGVSVSARYSSNNDFVRENSFDPREVVQSIDSNAGINRRFDWGTVALGATRRQFMSDDRVESKLPTVNLSLTPMTFFEAPANRASWYNNLTWSGGGGFERSSRDLADVPDSIVASKNLVDQVTDRANASSTFNLGAFSWGQQFGFMETTSKNVEILPPEPDTSAAQALLSPIRYGRTAGTAFQDEPTFMDISNANVTWSTSIDYQQRLIGSTTLTPTVAIAGQALRTNEYLDSIPEAANFVSAPVRISAGAVLKTDVYGFFPGFGSFEAVRHKFSPTFTWAYTPSSTPTDLQRRVFGANDLRVRNELRVGLNQTFEAKRRPSEEDEEPAAGAIATPGVGADSLGADSLQSAGADTLGADSLAAVRDSLRAAEREDPNAPRSMQRSDVVTLLALNTSAVTYDFVRADSLGSFDQGFETTRLTNQLSSDFLRGFTISMEHQLFKDIRNDEGEIVDREFNLHLTQLNLGFSLGSSSGIFRFLRGGSDEDQPVEPDLGDEDPFDVRTGTDEASLIPGRFGSGSSARDRQRQAGAAGVGGWNANIQYSLTRPADDMAGQRNQMVQWSLTFKPTEHWDVSWRSSYDLEASRFNDHMVRLSRDLHRWEANFDFRQTATGNWTFRFEVSLIDNRDLKFDYKQRDLETF